MDEVKRLVLVMIVLNFIEENYVKDYQCDNEVFFKMV